MPQKKRDTERKTDTEFLVKELHKPYIRLHSFERGLLTDFGNNRLTTNFNKILQYKIIPYWLRDAPAV